MIDKFISEHLINKDVEVYLGNKDVFEGKVVGSVDGVLSLIKDGKLTYINTPKIKCLWEK
ncbi:MAG: hypothetical protein EU549_00855 [Promethearchaeota archaeon]|nr:MAG: hypothetical protein EU549_00855 [Candidatus Lokiarchaeota archaeon]